MRAIAFGGLILALTSMRVATGLEGGLAFLVMVMAGVGALFLGALFFSPSRAAPDERNPATEDLAYLARLFMWGIVIRVALSIVLHLTGLWTAFAGDEGTFDVNGRVFALWLQGDLPFRLGNRFLGRYEVGYFYLVGGFYYTFGISKFALAEVSKIGPLFINCLAGASLVYPVHALAGYLGGRVAGRRAAMLVAFFPSMVIWSTVMTRDILTVFLLISALLCAERLRRGFHIGWLVALLVCVGALSTLRTYIFLVFTVAAAAGLLVGRRSLSSSLFLGGFVIVMLLVLVKTTGVGASELDKMNLEHIADLRRSNALGPEGTTGSLGTDVDISTPGRAIVYLPLGLLYFFFSPLPWQIRSTAQALALVDLAWWYSMIPAVLAGASFLGHKRLRAAFPVFVFVGATAVLYGLVEGNIGILFRHRAQVIVPLCVLAGVGYSVKKRRARKEARQRERPLPDHASARSALRPAPGL